VNPILDHPKPDFDELEAVLKGEREPSRVHLAELTIDQEILKAISERFLCERWISTDAGEPHFRQLVNMYWRLGYDYVPVWPVWLNHPSPLRRVAHDTSVLLSLDGKRNWVEEGCGLISSWNDLEQFQWTDIKASSLPLDAVVRHLPDGMRIAVIGIHFERVMEILLGYEGLFYLLHDDPELVAQVFDRWGQILYDYYASVIGMDEVGAIFHADDLGFKTSTLLSPDDLRKYVFPWFGRYAALAHEHGKMCWYHCCGNIYSGEVIEDLINDVKFDALHSFQDVILPVNDFKDRYGHRIATLGGADVDKLARLDEASVRRYVRDILDHCMPGGRFAMGSANSVTRYIPVENYCAMLEECRHW